MTAEVQCVLLLDSVLRTGILISKGELHSLLLYLIGGVMLDAAALRSSLLLRILPVLLPASADLDSGTCCV